MISKLEKEVTLRYLKTRKKDGFLNIISIFSFIGISLGVAVLIIVMSVMNGFRTELVEKIIGFNAHAVVKSYDQAISKKSIKSKELNDLSNKLLFSNSSEGVLINKDYTKGLLLRGYLRNEFEKLDIVKNQNFNGNRKLNSKFISIGKELSFNFDIKIGDKVLIMSPAGIQTIIGNLPKQETYIVDSIFDSGLSDFDQNIVFINIKDLENLFDLDESKRFLEIYLKDPKKIEFTKKKLQEIFNQEYVYTWSDLNKPLFSALKVERNVMFIILSLIIIVAAFNIISGLTILVKNKTKEIAILKSIGVQNKSITKIFFMVGFFIGSIATLFGIILGVLFSVYIENIRQLLSNIFNITIFPEEIYFLSKMPSEINVQSIFLIAICSIIITSIVSIYPAIKASNLDPVKALKYE
ncbi:MAG: FtsX-like permease family protein [Candidatus Pelagibacter bacterium]|nr:FtsX-like permease family protein [Candidatus Pelagibacter bacterium]